MASSTKRRDAGAGSVYQRKDGMWVAAVTLPDAPGGKRRRKVVSHRTKAGVEKKLREVRRELDRTGDLPTSSPTVATWMEQWLTMQKKQSKPTSVVTMRGQYERYILPTVGKKKLEKLTPDDVRSVSSYITDELGLSATTAANVHGVLVAALSTAEMESKVTRNVARLVRRPQRAVNTRGSLSVDDARRVLLSVAGDLPQAARWSVALLLGMRQGEALGLTSEHVDLDRGLITVAWQLQRLRWEHGCGERPQVRGTAWPCGKQRGAWCPKRFIGIPAHHEARQVEEGLWLVRPKTRSGWRQVPIPEPLRLSLKRYIDANPPGKMGLIFRRDDGRPFEPEQDRKAWAQALADAGVGHVPLHSARHTTATLLHALGVPDATRVKILGHSTAAVTAGYTHVSDPEMREAMNKLGSLLDPRGQIEAA